MKINRIMVLWLAAVCSSCAVSDAPLTVNLPAERPAIALEDASERSISAYSSGIVDNSQWTSSPLPALSTLAPEPVMRDEPVQPPLSGQNRVAMVIGNSNYRNTSTLKNPHNDATGIGSALRELGFDVVFGTDRTKQQLDEDIRQFSSRATGADVALFFYSGHALQIDGKNWMLPVDANVQSPADVELQANSMDLVMRQMTTKAGLNIVLLDACRDNPFASAMYTGSKGNGNTRGLSRSSVSGEMYVAYATAPGEVAFDGRGDYSPFSEAILRHIKKPGVDLDELMRLVRKDVKTVTSEERVKQVPWSNSSLTQEFYFSPLPAG